MSSSRETGLFIVNNGGVNIYATITPFVVCYMLSTLLCSRAKYWLDHHISGRAVEEYAGWISSGDP